MMAAMAAMAAETRWSVAEVDDGLDSLNGSNSAADLMELGRFRYNNQPKKTDDDGNGSVGVSGGCGSKNGGQIGQNGGKIGRKSFVTGGTI